MPSNFAAWQTADKAQPLEIKEAPYTLPDENQIVVKNKAVAINPVDAAIQLMGSDIMPHIVYPCILGEDAAGEVVEVGSSVSKFKVGDRVLGLASGIMTNELFMSAFQAYSTVQANVVSHIPSSLSFESACVLPLCLATAASGLFLKNYLALEYPSLQPQPTGKSLLIWGGASSVGSNAIQLAVAAGYEVVTTCSPKNFGYVKKLGASQVFDYNSATVVNDLIDALKDKEMAGALSAAITGSQETVDVVAKFKSNRFVSLAMVPRENVPPGVEAKFINNDDLKGADVGAYIYGEFLPKALAEGRYIAAPDFEVAGKGLESIQAGLDLARKGMSAKKVVVSL